LTKLLEGQTSGDPMTGRKWVRRSLRHLSGDLGKQGHHACPNTVGRLLRKQDFSLKSNRKGHTGKAHPDRDLQFQHIQEQRERFTAAGLPVVSVDSKKKELVGNFKNAGVGWCRKAESVNTYDFIHDAQCRASPYALYDPTRNCGMVAVGTSADTAQFAADCLEHWWRQEGRRAYPQARQLLVLADGGGSNGHRSRLFKSSLQQFANHSDVAVTVCHYPTGASKWNPVEHRLLSQISINWAGKPLRSLDAMLGYIRGTVTETGLRVRAWLNKKVYPTKVKISDAQMKSLNLERLPTCPDWNYTIHPLSDSSGP
jgi:Rhodopirellula transposase DDE domain